MTENGLIILAVVILLLAAGREVVCWYYKIHKRIDLLEEISEKLTILINQNEK